MSANPNRLAPHGITCHAWNKDGSKVALCPNNNEILIYAKSGNAFKLEHTLKEHDQVVTGIDWAPNSNRIVSCSQDRNAYVWTLEGNQWKPVLVILRVDRCATHVKWSPLENKFAVATGQKLVSVCYFEPDNDWWVSKHIRKPHRSTVMKVDWHPNNMLLATASTDYKARVFSAFIKVSPEDKKNKAGDHSLGNCDSFGDCLAEFNCGGWVKSVKWSPSGNQLAYIGHDSSLSVVDCAQGPSAAPRTYFDKELPHMDLVWTSESAIVAAGFSNTPVQYAAAGPSLVKKLDTGNNAASAGPAKSSAFNVFKDKVDRGGASSSQGLKTKHQNTITCLSVSGGKLISTGIDGFLFTWDAPK